jgi:hypothetical protein
MNHEEFAAEVHRKLCARSDEEMVDNPHGAVMQIARQIAFQHPFAWCREMWLGRHARKALRDRMRKEREKQE